MTAFRIALGCAAAALLSACNVGEGNRPEALRFISSTTDTETLASENAYLCFTRSLVVLAEFTDGIPGLFTDRVTYTSDNPQVVRVSNGDLLVPGKTDQLYNRGVLLPVSAGTATITAEFEGLVATIPVTVKAPAALDVRNQTMTDSDGATEHEVTQIVPDSFLALRAMVKFEADDEEQNLSEAGDWTTTAPEDNATVGAVTGLVTALAAPATPATYSASVSFPPCSGLDGAPGLPSSIEASQLTTSFEVRDPVELRIVTEPDYPTNGQKMINGSAQFIRVLADFDADPNNGEGQDLTLLGISLDFSPECDSDSSTAAPACALNYSRLTGLLIAGQTAAEPVSITAQFGEIADPADAEETLPRFTSSSISLGVQAATLDSIVLAPANPTLAEGEDLQMAATGRFTVNGVAAAQTWPVNHDVIWSSSDSSFFTVSNFTTLAGLLTALETDEAPDEPLILTVTSNTLIPATPGAVTPTPTPQATATVTLAPVAKNP